MGVGILMSTRIAEGGPSHHLAIDTMPEAAMVTTYSASNYVTDSAAAATALATGVKTNNGMLGMNPDKKKIRTILEAAQGMGKATGLVTTVTITHATPAGFIAHVANRGEETAIAEQMAVSGINVLMGGGKSRFVPQDVKGSSRKDSRNIIDEMKGKGYTFIDTNDALLSCNSSKILGLFWDGYRPGDKLEPALSDMAGKAIDALSKDKDGFFLMVEGGQIDSEAHGNNIRGAVNQTVDFDKAVARALEFAKADGRTLVVVTSDHDTGGSAVKDSSDSLNVKWIDGGHTGNPVQLYAYGPGSELFDGLMDNTDVPKTFAKLWKVKIGLQD